MVTSQIALLLGVLLSAVLAVATQNAPKVSAQDEREAKAVAEAFFQKYLETTDLTPLLREFFVTDFPTRLKFCGTSDEDDCGGFGKDFWEKNEELTKLNGEEADFKRVYVNKVNYLFLYTRSVSNLQIATNGKTEHESMVLAEKLITRRLGELLKEYPKALQYHLFANPDSVSPEYRTLDQYTNGMLDFERLNQALRTIENETRPKNKSVNRTISFRIDYKDNIRRFFKYPSGTRIIEAWPDEFQWFPFKIDMIRNKGKLQIVAIYPPID